MSYRIFILFIAACGPAGGVNGSFGGELSTVCDVEIEVCNGVDDDCDGMVDEAPDDMTLRETCETACGVGTRTCLGGGWSDCSAGLPEVDVCNGVDDDCNGMVDDGCDCIHGETRSCGVDVGACRPGIEQCVNGTWTETCHGVIASINEICHNGVDDNCDGAIDEDCECMPGETLDCGTDVGECSAGVIRCSETSRWGDTCEGEVRPTAETCNGLDDDCDGEVDWNINTDTGWRADPLESNDTCGSARVLPDLDDGDPWMSLPVADVADLGTYPTVYPEDDVDWYRFRANDGGGHGFCWPGSSQCAFVLQVQLTVPSGVAHDEYEMCFAVGGGCGEINSGAARLFCTSQASWLANEHVHALAVKWAGECAFDDSRDVRVFVRSNNANACGYYQVSTRFYYDPNESCP